LFVSPACAAIKTSQQIVCLRVNLLSWIYRLWLCDIYYPLLALFPGELLLWFLWDWLHRYKQEWMLPRQLLYIWSTWLYSWGRLYIPGSCTVQMCCEYNFLSKMCTIYDTVKRCNKHDYFE